MIDIGKKCCGCTACKNACPQKCIQMEQDGEGFIYPVVDTNICVKCGICLMVCPVLSSSNSERLNREKYGFIFQNSNMPILKESTSGGFFTALARYTIERDGIVFGAAYDEKFYIRHTFAKNIDDLKLFRNSKYTQCDPQNSFEQCKEFLEEGKLVLYSGTPCQIEGLKAYLKKEYENLITADVICRGVPSPGLFETYIKWNGGADTISDIRFRKKYKGYFNSFMEVSYISGKCEYREKHTDPMLSFFFNDLCSRSSCYNCCFKTVDRVSDFTMFDCWHAHAFYHKFGDKGATAVIARNNKAREIMKTLSIDNICIEYDYNELIKADGIMLTNSVEMNPKREEFFYDLSNMDFDCLIERYNHQTLIRVWSLRFKTLLMKLGVFGKILQLRMR